MVPRPGGRKPLKRKGTTPGTGYLPGAPPPRNGGLPGGPRPGKPVGGPGQLLPGVKPRPGKQIPGPGQMLPGVRPVATRRPIAANTGTRSTRGPLNAALRPGQGNQLKPVTKRPVRKTR